MAVAMRAENQQVIREVSWGVLRHSRLLARAYEEVMRSFLLGQTALPLGLGLEGSEFEALTRSLLDGRSPDDIAESLVAQGHARDLAGARERAELRYELLDARRDELLSLEELLMAHRTADHPVDAAWARVISAGCLGNQHLWEDLGLSSRLRLSELLQELYPALVAKNTGDMRWKRFFYRLLCEEGGDYICRAPSCGECASYAVCFLSEEERAAEAGEVSS